MKEAPSPDSCGIDTREAANAYAPHFIADLNNRFGKKPKSTYNAHLGLRGDEDLDLILSCRVSGCVSNTLTAQYDPVIYLSDDSPVDRARLRNASKASAPLTTAVNR
jgi:hypothetical protein